MELGDLMFPIKFIIEFIYHIFESMGIINQDPLIVFETNNAINKSCYNHLGRSFSVGLMEQK